MYTSNSEIYKGNNVGGFGILKFMLTEIIKGLFMWLIEVGGEKDQMSG